MIEFTSSIKIAVACQSDDPDMLMDIIRSIDSQTVQPNKKIVLANSFFIPELGEDWSFTVSSVLATGNADFVILTEKPLDKNYIFNFHKTYGGL